IALMFGTRWLATLAGFAFFSHQVGGFLGVWLGGLVFDRTGSYNTVWWLAILFGVLSAVINMPIVEKPVARVAAVPACRFRHARPQPFIERHRFRSPFAGHPRPLCFQSCKTWMAGTRPAMTPERFCMSTFKAIVIDKTDAGQTVQLTDFDEKNLMDGDVTVRVEWSTVNYKDGLAVTGKAPVVRRFPMIAGVDFAGMVESSTHPGWKAGDKVILNGWGLGETHLGAYAEKA